MTQWFSTFFVVTEQFSLEHVLYIYIVQGRTSRSFEVIFVHNKIQLNLKKVCITRETNTMYLSFFIFNNFFNIGRRQWQKPTFISSFNY